MTPLPPRSVLLKKTGENIARSGQHMVASAYYGARDLSPLFWQPALSNFWTNIVKEAKFFSVLGLTYWTHAIAMAQTVSLFFVSFLLCGNEPPCKDHLIASAMTSHFTRCPYFVTYHPVHPLSFYRIIPRIHTLHCHCHVNEELLLFRSIPVVCSPREW
jgi:hypothetical protein